MSCSPSYTYRPTERSSPGQSIAPSYSEHRSRLFAGGTFFRSKEQGDDQNLISLEVSTGGGVTLTVRVSGVIEETFTVSQTVVLMDCVGGIDDLRSAVNGGSSVIEMPARGTDFFDSGGSDASDNCASSFPDTPMTGGSGLPFPPSQALLDSIFTGIDRTMAILLSTEDANGNDTFGGPGERVKQWNGVNWVTYANLIQGACPLDG